VELTTQPSSPMAVDIGANYRWLKNRDMTEIEQHLAGGIAYKVIQNPIDGESVIHRQKQRGFLERSATYRRLMRQAEVGELKLVPRPLVPPDQHEEVKVEGYEPLGDATKPLPVGYGAKFHTEEFDTKRYTWANTPLSETAEVVREMTPEELKAEAEEERKEQEEADKDIILRIEDWELEHLHRYPTYDWQKDIYYTDLVKNPALRKRLEAEAALKTTTVTDKLIASLIQKREKLLYARAEEYWDRIQKFVAKGGVPFGVDPAMYGGVTPVAVGPGAAGAKAGAPPPPKDSKPGKK